MAREFIADAMGVRSSMEAILRFGLLSHGLPRPEYVMLSPNGMSYHWRVGEATLVLNEHVKRSTERKAGGIDYSVSFVPDVGVAITHPIAASFQEAVERLRHHGLPIMTLPEFYGFRAPDHYTADKSGCVWTWYVDGQTDTPVFAILAPNGGGFMASLKRDLGVGHDSVDCIEPVKTFPDTPEGLNDAVIHLMENLRVLGAGVPCARLHVEGASVGEGPWFAASSLRFLGDRIL